MKSTAEAAARPARHWASGLTFCPACHAAIHSSGDLQDHYHKQGQLLAEAYYHWNHDDFRRRFYINYLEE